MLKLPSNVKYNEIESILNKMFHPEWLRATAIKVGYVQRNRKIDTAVFFWVVVLGFGVGMKRTLAALRRAYETVSAETLVPSSFYARFNKGLVDFLRECLSHGVEELCRHTSTRLSDKLADFKDIVVSDGTIVRLHEKLANKFPGTRGKAEAKIHLVSGITGNTKTMAIYSGKTPDVKTLRIGTWVKDSILLFDLGYYKYELFGKIIYNRGYFVSRLKKTSNPTIVSVLHENQACSEDLAGKNLQDVLHKLEGKVVDLQVEVSFKRKTKKDEDLTNDNGFEIYPSRGKTTKTTVPLRLIGTHNDESGDYHFYLTNIEPSQLAAEDIALLYKVRWSIELLFKELKSLYKLDVIKSGAASVVESLILVAMLTLVVSHRLLNHIRSLVPAKSSRMTSMRWGEVFYTVASIIMDRVLKGIGVEEDPIMLMVYLMTESVDPNVTRGKTPLLQPWVVAENSQVLNPNK